jgi:hypothetical protein
MSHPGSSEEDIPFEDRSFTQDTFPPDTVENDAVTPGPESRWREPDADTCAFQEPGEAPRTYWRGPGL